MPPLLLLSALFLPAANAPKPGPTKVTTVSLDWKDAGRDREVPVKLYLPEVKGPSPVVVFSHGLGGSRDGYEYLGKHWASHGFACVHVQHKSSDDGVWKDLPVAERMAAMRKAATAPANFLNRPKDVAFVLDELTKLNKKGEYEGRFDLEKVGMAGHSFGAHTTLACCGQVYAALKKEMTFTEPRVKAAVAMSPSAPAKATDLKKSFGSIKVPVYHLTGTKDDGAGVTEVEPRTRRVPYDNISGAPQYLTVFEGGDHMVFSGRPRTKKDNGKKDAEFQAHVLTSTTAFWKAHLLGDEKARAWLTGQFPKELGSDGKFESKK